ncbi:glycosyl hydrolase family 8 [Bacillus sp. 1P06AnD]|uniref:glycosyl hydrolase family 8 n=1 Tax=Bacillus sp. 1P06AnD TaxID=3132208 RepID=UPI0039A2FEF7
MSMKKRKTVLSLLFSLLLVSLIPFESSEAMQITTSNAEGTNETISPQATAANKPFPQHTKYFAGTIKPNHVTQSKMDQEVKRLYGEWKNRYLKKDPNKPDRYYVYYNLENYSEPANAVSSSEGHGYGMLTTALMAGYDSDAKTYFDGLYRFYKDHPSSIDPSLMAWQQVKNSSGNIITNPDGGDDAATDGDMDIAYALLLADKQWGSSTGIHYLNEAKKVMKAIMSKEVHHSEWILKLGDWASDTDTKYGTGTRSSDFMLEHLNVFRNVSGDSNWQKVKDKTSNIINSVYQAYSPNTGLLPDFNIKKNGKYQPAAPYYLESENDGKYSWNSSRVPWRISMDFIINGNTSANNQLNKLNTWIKQKASNNPSKIMAGYELNGQPLENYNSIAFTAPFAVSAMLQSGNQSWLNALWDYTVQSPTSENAYFDNSIRILCMIIVSGNWWSPN